VIIPLITIWAIISINSTSNTSKQLPLVFPTGIAHAENIDKANLHSYLYARVRGLKKAIQQGNDLEAVRILRNFAATSGNRCRGKYCRKRLKQTIKFPLEKEIKELTELKLSYWCAGFANYLAKIYAEFGFPAASLNVGMRNGTLSHVFTLVEIRHQGKRMVVAQDAYLNAEYAIKGKMPTNFNRFMHSITSQSGNATLFDYYPNSLRNGIRYHSVDGEGKVHNETMFNHTKWFYSNKKRAERISLAADLGVPLKQLNPFHMLFLPLGHTIFKKGYVLNRQIKEYLRYTR
jgi:hypothetical protein